MKKVSEARRFTTDEPEVKRTAYVVEEQDVGKTQKNYLGQEPYTFQADDVGRVLEVVQNKSPGSMSWRFGSMFNDITATYPESKPYLGAPSAGE